MPAAGSVFALASGEPEIAAGVTEIEAAGRCMVALRQTQRALNTARRNYEFLIKTYGAR